MASANNAAPSSADHIIVVQADFADREDSVCTVSKELERIIPPGDVFVLVDDASLGICAVGDRRALPFLEHDGVYWGPPPDDDTAIRELERMRQAGASFIAFSCSAFWWLLYYESFNAYLCANFPHLVHRRAEQASLIVFDLRGSDAPTHSGAALEWRTERLLFVEPAGVESKDGSFPGSAAYWEKRYSAGGTSGVGSYGRFAQFKADVLNLFVATHRVRAVIEFGCGDGNQLTLAKYPGYLGFDVSSAAVSRCRERFGSDASKSFRLMNEYAGQTAELTLSLDVIYHLVEDDVFEQYMETLFGASERYVIIYASDSEDSGGHGSAHVRHRKFTRWIQQNIPSWNLIEHLPSRYPYTGDYRTGSFAEFFIYKKQ